MRVLKREGLNESVVLVALAAIQFLCMQMLLSAYASAIFVHVLHAIEARQGTQPAGAGAVKLAVPPHLRPDAR